MPINLTLDLVPLGNFPLLDDNYIKGGFQIVADATARDAIPDASRKEGMLVWVQGTSTLYKLGPGVTNGDWAVFSLGGGVTGPGSSTTNAIARWVDSSGTSLSNSILTLASDGVLTSSGSSGIVLNTVEDATAKGILIQPGNSTSGIGADIDLKAGTANAPFSGGSIDISAASSNTTGSGGVVYISAGDSNGTGLAYNGGFIQLQAGTANDEGNGGRVEIIGGDGGVSGAGPYNGGNIILIPGYSGINGTQGLIKLKAAEFAPELCFSEDSANGTNYFSLKAASSMADNNPYTWPDAYPASNGYVLSATTDGTLSWAAAGGGGGGSLQDAYDAGASIAVSSGGNGPITLTEGTKTVTLSPASITFGDTTTDQDFEIKANPATRSGKPLNLRIYAQHSSDNSGSIIEILGGDGTDGGPIAVTAGTGSSGTGGNIQLNAGVGTGSGGNVILVAGDGTPSGLISIYPDVGGSPSRLAFYNGATTNYVGFVAPTSLNSSTIWTLPSVDGDPNSILQTNGSGILSWATGGVTGPEGSTTNALATWNGTSGTSLNSTGVVLSGAQTILASAGDLVVGGTAASTATQGVITVRRVPNTISTSQTLINGSIARVDVSEGDITATLPNPNVSAGQNIQIISVGSTGGVITITAATGNTNGTTNIACLAVYGRKFNCICDGTDWWVTSEDTPALNA